jgi:hypothetical protein
LVGEVYKVRTQVDRDLTTISSFDRLLWLNKNLGCHIEPQNQGRARTTWEPSHE